MKNTLRTILFSVSYCLLLSATAQPNRIQKPAHNPYNYFLNPDTVHRVDINPFLWKDYPNNLSNPVDLKHAYLEAKKVGNGYKILQLAKLEFDHVYTYGNLVPSRMLQEAYSIALKESDPYLAYYVVRFDCRYNLSFFYTYEQMMKQVDSLAMCHKNSDVLNQLAGLADTFALMKHSTPLRVRAKALFINNPNYAPYFNPYDCPQAGKPLNDIPFLWKDFPVEIKNQTQFNVAYKAALKINDGYRLLQLTKVGLDNKLINAVTAKTILYKTYNIACYNKDPYLLLYVCLYDMDKHLLNPTQPAEIFRQAYNTAIERRHSLPLYDMCNVEKKYDLLPDVIPMDILKIGLQQEKFYPIKYDFEKWVSVPLKKYRPDAFSKPVVDDEYPY